MSRSRLEIVYGAMGFGLPGSTITPRVLEPAVQRQILDVHLAHGHTKIDTSRAYNMGQSEQALGDLDPDRLGIVVDTKFFPTLRWGMPAPAGVAADADGLKNHLTSSIDALKVKQLDVWYLHRPDRETPLTETLKAVDALYKEGHFKRFGVSQFSVAEVEELVRLSEEHNWVRVSVYQGIYNAVTRIIEPELLPVLKKHEIAFYAFNCSGGGFLTNAIADATDTGSPGSRFDHRLYDIHRRFYTGREGAFDALASIKKKADEHGLTVSEVALRWLNHHSLLTPERGDALISGGSTVAQHTQNLVDFAKGPLPSDVVSVLDQAWETVFKPGAEPYDTQK